MLHHHPTPHLAAARRRAAATLVAAAALLSAAVATADPTDARPDAEIARRLSFVEQRLSRATPTARLWWSTWFYGYVVVTVGQAGFSMIVKDKGLRTDTAVGAAFSSLGVLGLGVAGFPPRDAAAALRTLPAGTPAERRRKLAHGERLLAAGARAEVGGRSWVAQVAGVGVTLASSLVLAFAYKRVVSGVVTLVSGVGITEAQIFTRPTAAIDDWRAYQQGAWAGSNTSTVAAPRSWTLVAQPGGLGVAAAF